MDKDYISASQVADYLYCHRSYWLAQKGKKRLVSKAMREGSASHKELAAGAAQVQQGERRGNRGYLLAAALILLACLLLVFR